MNKYIVIIVSVFVLFSCSKSKNVELNTSKIEISRIEIPITPLQLNSYQVAKPYVAKSKQNQLIAYNSIQHSLDFFNLDRAEVIKSTSLESEGPNGIGRIESIHVVSEDSILVYGRGKIHLLDQKLQKERSWDLYRIYGDKNLGEPICNFYFKLYYDVDSKNAYFFMNPIGLDQAEKSAQPLVTSLNLDTEELNVLPIYHTDHFKSANGRLGFITYLGFYGELENKLIYNYQYESGLYSFDLNGSGHLESSFTDKDYVPAAPSSDDPRVFDMHAIENAHYLSPIPDPFKSLIYRFSWKAPRVSNVSREFPDKSQSLSVFDKDLNLIQDFSLPDYTYQINNWFVNVNGLYLNVAHPGNQKMNEDYLTFDIIRFSR